jgi:hypothetical protein
MQNSHSKKVYHISCTERTQLWWFLQRDVPGSYGETYPSSSHDSKQVLSIKVEEGLDIDEEENPVPVTFPGVQPQYEVSCMSVCLQ